LKYREYRGADENEHDEQTCSKTYARRLRHCGISLLARLLGQLAGGLGHLPSELIHLAGDGECPLSRDALLLLGSFGGRDVAGAGKIVVGQLLDSVQPLAIIGPDQLEDGGIEQLLHFLGARAHRRQDFSRVLRRLRQADITDRQLAPLHVDKNVGRRLDDALLQGRLRCRLLDRAAAELLVENHAGYQHNADGGRNCELGADAKLET